MSKENKVTEVVEVTEVAVNTQDDLKVQIVQRVETLYSSIGYTVDHFEFELDMENRKIVMKQFKAYKTEDPTISYATDKRSFKDICSKTHLEYLKNRKGSSRSKTDF